MVYDLHAFDISYQRDRSLSSKSASIICNNDLNSLMIFHSGLRPGWRAFELAASFLGLLVLTPVMLVLMAAVRLTSSGPALFGQPRVGRGGNVFVLYKLRSMYTGTCSVPTHEVADEAFTPLGRFLRRWKLDELPQLYNVLVGDMSLVGPRPCLPSQIELIDARWREGILDAMPGMTGLAQVQNIDMSNAEKLAQVDAEYLRNQTATGDLKLLLRTFFAISK